MKIVIFAGGIGTRLWPLSRKNTPKQFEKIIGDKSTLQQTVDRIISHFSANNVFIATGKRYQEIVLSQLPRIPRDNFIFEPEMRDVGPAIGLATSLIAKKFRNEPLAILWSDHVVKNDAKFYTSLLTAEDLLKKRKATFVFIAQKPRFANQNIGWIELGDQINWTESTNIYKFKRLHYRPELAEAEKFYANSKFVWNLGYFITTPDYLLSIYRHYLPLMHNNLLKIQDAYGTKDFENVLNSIYPKLEKVSFDDAVLTKLTPDNMCVISEDIGWSDVGAWEALKEALAENEQDNVTHGEVMIEDCQDSLIYNYNNQLVVGIDIEKMLIINTEDVLLVCPKTSVPKIKKLVEKLSGTPHEDLA